jgi:hypothetical protein
MARSYLVNAVDTALNGAVGGSDGTITVADGSELPTVPFYLAVDPFSSTDGREYMLCTAINGNVLTVTRNLSGTASTTHPTGDVVRISYVAQLLDDLWDALDGANSLPAGGLRGDSLRKQSQTDGDAEWSRNVTFSATAPTSPLTGDWWADLDDEIVSVWDGSDWQNVAQSYLPLAGGSIVGDQDLLLNVVRNITASDTAPASPNVGEVWIDTSGA